MATTIAIACIPGDVHVFAVTEALRAKGAEAWLWYTADFPGRAQETLTFKGQRVELMSRDSSGRADLRQIETVWARRIGFGQSYEGLHSADRAFAEIERRRFREGCLQAAFPEAFWVNPAYASLRCENKLYQQSVAVACGLQMPPTLFSNDPLEIRGFLKGNGGTVVYKPISGAGWSDGQRSWACHTVALTEDDLVEEFLLQAVPGIYQALVPKAYEIRLTMIGERPFAAKILSQDTDSGRVDWRRAYSELRMEPIEVSCELVATCTRLMRLLGLVFGCFDFIVTPTKETVFLEVNQMGQFLFIEQSTGMRILDAFTELLLQRRPDFAWNPESAGLRFEEVATRARELASESLLQHERVDLIPVNEKR